MNDESHTDLGGVEYDPATDEYYATHAPDDAPPSTAIPRAVAAITDRPVADLVPLQHAIDPDALDDLLDDRSLDDRLPDGGDAPDRAGLDDGDAPDRAGTVEVSFAYAGFDVTASSSGVVVFAPVDPEE